MKVDLTPEQLATIRLALVGWTVRCEGEAKAMESLRMEVDTEALRNKCTRNAAASREMKADAEALLKALP